MIRCISYEGSREPSSHVIFVYRTLDSMLLVVAVFYDLSVAVFMRSLTVQGYFAMSVLRCQWK